jgi:hypothetical protein
MGVERTVALLLWALCIAVLGSASRAFIYPQLFDKLTRKTRASRASRNGSRCRLSHQATRDLQTWMRLATEAEEGRPVRPLATNGIIHTNATDVGVGGTLAFICHPGDPGTWQDQVIWRWRDRAERISMREL